MAVRICQVELTNFRGVRSGRVVLPRHSVLLGGNNVGKSTVAEALALLAGREGLTKPLCDWDFYGGQPTSSFRFRILATITDFGQPGDEDPTHYPDWFVGECAATPVWWDNNQEKVIAQTDPPPNTRLAAQVALTGRYDEEICEFEVIRFFYDGECDPFIDDVRRLPSKLLRDLGVFFLPSQRQWDRLLAFGSSTFLKVLREYKAVPGEGIAALKNELRTKVTPIETLGPLKDILAAAEDDLRSFVMLTESGKLAYRPTSLDTLSILRALMPHMIHEADLWVPVERSGSGLIALQSLVLLLAFSRKRIDEGRTFILVADEPELHLHPSLHRRLVQRIRSSSSQSIVMTQSPGIAAGYQPSEVLFLSTSGGELHATRLRTEPVNAIGTNAVKKLYLDHRQELYDSLMGSMLVVPEGKWDWRWLTLWQRVAETASDGAHFCPISVIPTQDGAVVESYKEVRRLRPDAVPLVDGDGPGNTYASGLCSLTTPPSRIIRLGQDAGIECLCAWILEPALANPPGTLQVLLPDPAHRTLKYLQGALADGTNKKDSELQENLAWEASENKDCVQRACQFLEDIAAIASGRDPSNPAWAATDLTSGVRLFQANHIRRA